MFCHGLPLMTASFLRCMHFWLEIGVWQMEIQDLQRVENEPSRLGADDIFGTEFKHQQRATFSILSGMPGIVHQVHYSGSPINIALKIHRCTLDSLRKNWEHSLNSFFHLIFSFIFITDLIYEPSIDLYSDFSLHEWSWHWSSLIILSFKKNKRVRLVFVALI